MNLTKSTEQMRKLKKDTKKERREIEITDTILSTAATPMCTEKLTKQQKKTVRLQFYFC